MTRLPVALLLALLAGCTPPSEDADTAPGDTPAETTASATTAEAPEGSRSLLVDRVWVRSDSTRIPGTMQVFLSDGTLLTDSCWETHRLSAWTAEADSAVRWQEDGQDVRASIVALTSARLTLRVNGEDQAYAPAEVPYLCPDIPG